MCHAVVIHAVFLEELTWDTVVILALFDFAVVLVALLVYTTMMPGRFRRIRELDKKILRFSERASD